MMERLLERLLDSLLNVSQGNGFVTGIPPAFGEGDTGKRIRNVLDYKKTTKQVIIAGVLIVTLALAALGADPVEKAAAGNGDAAKVSGRGDGQMSSVDGKKKDGKKEELTIGQFCQIVDEGRLLNCDFHGFANGSYDGLGDDALNYYVGFSFANELGDYTLDFSYMKKDESLDAVYLTRQWDGNMLLVYSLDGNYGAGGPPDGAEIAAFLAGDFDILNEISFRLPEGLELEPYQQNVGTGGGRLFSPDASKGGESTPPEWTAAGMVGRYYQKDMLVWKDGDIQDIAALYNHSVMKYVERVAGLDYPAVIMHGTHDLYTAVEEAGMERQGKSYEPVSDYWYLFIAREGDTYGYVISLNQKNYSKDDMIALSKTVRLLGEAGNGL